MELVERCLAGDPISQRAFVETFQSSIFGLCFRMTGQREDAEDVTQEVFARAFRSLAGWDAERPLRPWLMMIAANCCRTALSRRARQPVPSELVEDFPDQTVAVPHGDFAETVQTALMTLREDHRTCFVLFYEQELSVTEIGAVMGCPEGTVKTWLYRARRDVADFLRQRGYGESDEQ